MDAFVIHRTLLVGDDAVFGRAPGPRQAAGAGVVCSVLMGDPVP